MQESYGSSYEFYIEKSRAEYMQRLVTEIEGIICRMAMMMK